MLGQQLANGLAQGGTYALVAVGIVLVNRKPAAA